MQVQLLSVGPPFSHIAYYKYLDRPQIYQGIFMPNYTLPITVYPIIVQSDFSSTGRPGTLLNHRTEAEALYEEARFNRWAENERGRHYRDRV